MERLADLQTLVICRCRELLFFSLSSCLIIVGTTLRYKPGFIVGGEITHDCGKARGIGYFLEPLVCIALFGRKVSPQQFSDLPHKFHEPEARYRDHRCPKKKDPLRPNAAQSPKISHTSFAPISRHYPRLKLEVFSNSVLTTQACLVCFLFSYCYQIPDANQ
jgi:hypothetical protein